MTKKDELNEEELLARNPNAAKVLENNRKKLRGRPRPRQRDYSLGLPYARPALVAETEGQIKIKADA